MRHLDTNGNSYPLANEALDAIASGDHRRIHEVQLLVCLIDGVCLDKEEREYLRTAHEALYEVCTCLVARGIIDVGPGVDPS